MSLLLPRRDKLSLLQDAEQLDLGVPAQFADFVEQQRSIASLFEISRSARRSAGESAFFATEQLGLDERFGDRAARHRDESLLFAVALGMNGAGNELFTGAAFARDQNKRIEAGDTPDQIVYRLRFRAEPTSSPQPNGSTGSIGSRFETACS